ncbi:MAG: hypothetical protein AVDCRST_MAG89-1979 [uncultured Gemmatimonadetes bacterium]|uniref:Uncharacterized protein n=1 Tax=uncultured Gemmatimonadota bacterium TaxID=203437 RepID=A0A6J4LD57_9BACT|nr:MAG: hypothetical protein AVDCRST_MAG89-1979 [uncultured Gemmatimonadota bacterium]
MSFAVPGQRPLDDELLFFAAPPLRADEPLLPDFPLLDVSLELADLRAPLDFFAAVPERDAGVAVAPSTAPATAPAMAPTSAFFLRELVAPDLSADPAVKPTEVFSGMEIVVPVRGFRPVRAARVRRVNLPKPGIWKLPAEWTTCEMAPVAVSKIASITRSASARDSPALSATRSTNSFLAMMLAPLLRWREPPEGAEPAAPQPTRCKAVANVFGERVSRRGAETQKTRTDGLTQGHRATERQKRRGVLCGFQ